MKHLNEEQLILYYYGETDAGADASHHLSSCAACRESFDSLRRVLDAVEPAPVPERASVYGTEVWYRLRPLLPRGGRGWGAILPFPRWATAGATAALLVGAFLLGRYWQPPALQPAAPVAEGARERILLDSVGDHLDRSQLVLVEVMNSPGNGHVDISVQQALAEELLNSNRLYRLEAARSGEAGMSAVLEELERFLIEIARAPSYITTPELEEIRGRIELQGILFKVRVIGSQLRERGVEAAREMARRTS